MVDHYCPNCGSEWQAGMFYELGGWFYDPEKEDDDPFCSICETEGEIR